MRSPVDVCFGTSPSRRGIPAFREHVSLPIAATIALDRANARDRHQSLAGLILTGQRFDLARETLDTLIEPAPVFRQTLDDAQHARRERIDKLPGNSSCRECRLLPHGDAPLQQERADLIDDAGTLTDQSIADAVQCLKVELIGGPGRDELQGRALDGLGDGLRIAEVILRGWHMSTRSGNGGWDEEAFRRHGITPMYLDAAAK